MTWYDDGGNTPPHEPPPSPNWVVAPWPACLQCGKEYIPVRTIDGCPWCIDKATERRPTHLQNEYRACPTCGGPMRRHAKHCRDCYRLQRRRGARA